MDARSMEEACKWKQRQVKKKEKRVLELDHRCSDDTVTVTEQRQLQGTSLMFLSFSDDLTYPGVPTV